MSRRQHKDEPRIGSAERLRELIAQDEGDQLEFKLESEKLGDLAETLMSFANARGGSILVGVDDTGAIVGVEGLKSVSDRLLSAARLVSPALGDMLVVEVVEADSVQVVCATVPTGLPGTYTVSGSYRRRVGSYNVAMSPGDLAAHLASRGAAELDTFPAAEATLEDIDEAKVDRILARRAGLGEGEKLPPGYSRLTLAQKLANLHALAGERPTVAAALMFGSDPQSAVPNSQIQAARFAGTTMARFQDRAYLNGTLPEMIDASAAFVSRNTRHGLEIGGGSFRATEVGEYPEVAIREALVNAVCHREYLGARSPTRLLIFDDRIEIDNPGGLLPGLDIEHLAGKNALRNRLLAELLYLSGYIEKFGTGIIRMSEAMTEAGLPEPVLEASENSFKVTLFGPGAGFMRQDERQADALPGPRLSERQLRAYRWAVERGSITNRQYREVAGVGRTQAVDDLNTLVAEGVFEQQGRGPGTLYIPRRTPGN